MRQDLISALRVPAFVALAATWSALTLGAAPAQAATCTFVSCGQPVAQATVSCCSNTPYGPATPPWMASGTGAHEAGAHHHPAARTPHRRATPRAAARTKAPKAAPRVHRTASKGAAARSQKARTALRHTRHGVAGPDIRDHAAAYGAAGIGPGVPIAAYAGRGERWVSRSVHWVAPVVTSVHAGQVCGWGAQVIAAPGHHVQQSRQWLCQHPAGWRPPGY
jgi:hypothetical protein